MDSTWDRLTEPKVEAIIGYYKPKIDSLMDRVIGSTHYEMRSFRPQSPLSNFTTDAMMEFAALKGYSNIHFSLTNFGGLRAALPKGDIKVYNIFSIYPFENYLVILDLSGASLIKLFNSFARNRVEATSSNVGYRIEKGTLKELLIDGERVEPTKMYRVLTIDFLMDGGDNLSSLREFKEREFTKVLLRDAIIEVIESRSGRGEAIVGPLDKRVKIEN